MEPYDADAIEDEDEAFGEREGFEPSKEFLVFLIDCNETMFEKYEEAQGKTFFELAVESAAETLRSRIIASANDEIAVVFYSTRVAKNQSAFDHVFTYMDLDVPDAGRIRELSTMTVERFQEAVGSSVPTGSQPAEDLKYALWTTSQLFASRTTKATKKIFLFTNDEDPVGKAELSTVYRDQIKARADELHETGAGLRFFPMVKPGGSFSVDAFWRPLLDVLQGEEDDVEYGEDYDVGSHLSSLVEAVRRKMFRKRTLGTLKWNLTPELQIAVQIFNMVQPAYKGAAVNLLAQSMEPLRAETAYICNDTGAILPEINKFYFQLTTGVDKTRFPRVVFQSAETKEVKTLRESGLTLLGFKPRSQLKEYHQLAHSYFLYPAERALRGSTVAFVALMRSMALRNVVAIVSFMRAKSSETRLAALVPQLERKDQYNFQVDPPGMQLILLPFSDDVRAPEEEPQVVGLQSHIASQGQVDAAEELVAALSLPEFESCNVPNPAIQRHFNVLEAMALQEPPPELSEFLDDTVPDLAGMQRHAPILERFNDAVYGPEHERIKAEAASGSSRGTKRGNAEKAAGVAAADSGAFDWRQLASKDQLDKLKKDDLLIYIRANGLKSSGNKPDLIQRIKEHLGM